MFDDRSAFLNYLRFAPHDTDAALVFSDWLEENGDVDLAEFIRLQDRFAKLAKDDKSHESRALRNAHDNAHQAREAKVGERLLGAKYARLDWAFSFRRGFIETVRLPAQWLVESAVALIEEAPLLRKLIVGRVNGWGDRLAQLPVLRQIIDLEVQAWLAPTDAQALANSPHLQQLQSLEIWLGDPDADNAVLTAFASGVRTTYTNLRELRIIDIPGCRAETVAEANRLAGKDVAVAVLPYPRLYPIQADFFLWLFAGRLSDGTQALVDTKSVETGVRLFLFDSDGLQTEIRVIAVPPECLRQLGDEYRWEHTERIKMYLTREMNFTLGLIQIAELNDPTDMYRISEGNFEDHMIHPDDSEVCPELAEDVFGATEAFLYWFKLFPEIYVFWDGYDPCNVDAEGVMR